MNINLYFGIVSFVFPYARLSTSTAGIQRGLYSYIIISSKSIIQNSKGTFTVFPKQMCLLTKTSYQKGSLL